MHTISYYLGISKQSEVLFLVLAGICCTIFDASLFNLQTNLYKVWNAPLDPSKFIDTAQLYVKYILSSIVLVRTFTVHLYLAFYIVMLWPAIFEEKAGLLIPWLIVGAVKCLAMGAMSFSAGLYICLSYRFAKAACWDFLITQIIDQGPSIYMWFCVLSYYYDLKRKVPQPIYRPMRQTPSTVFSLAERRRRVKGLFDDVKLQNTFDDTRKLISVSTIDNIINQLNFNLNRETGRSLDSLLTRMAAEAEKEEILGLKEETLEEDENMTVAEKMLKALNLSESYVDSAKSRKTFLRPVSPSKDKTLKVQSSPLLVPKKSVDFLTSKRYYKLVPKKSDNLSLILSETEINSIGFTDDLLDIEEEKAKRKESSMESRKAIDERIIENQVEELELEEWQVQMDQHTEEKEQQPISSTSTGRLKDKLKRSKEKTKKSKKDPDFKELLIQDIKDKESFAFSLFEEDSVRPIHEETESKTRLVWQHVLSASNIKCADATVKNKNESEITKEVITNESVIDKEDAVTKKEILKGTGKTAQTKTIRKEKDKDANVPPVSSTPKASKIPSKITGTKVSNVQKVQPKNKAEPKTYSSSQASTKVPVSTRGLKPRNQRRNDLPTTSPTFKYDGYTLAYIESLQRKAATDILKNRRPSTSGT